MSRFYVLEDATLEKLAVELFGLGFVEGIPVETKNRRATVIIVDTKTKIFCKSNSEGVLETKNFVKQCYGKRLHFKNSNKLIQKWKTQL